MKAGADKQPMNLMMKAIVKRPKSCITTELDDGQKHKWECVNSYTTSDYLRITEAWMVVNWTNIEEEIDEILSMTVKRTNFS